jgi:hypothetical protein
MFDFIGNTLYSSKWYIIFNLTWLLAFTNLELTLWLYFCPMMKIA